ncbi:MAG: hypothetical protein L0Y35_06360 [Flammeovirgaceae bacterium]|nr:hypothetical protein [Flammeovirgaceae bacterium]
MSKSVHILQENTPKSVEKLILKNGTTVENKRLVNLKITYKEISLLIGILVALLIAFTLWFNQEGKTATEVTGKKSPKVGLLNIGKALVKQSLNIYQVR